MKLTPTPSSVFQLTERLAIAVTAMAPAGGCVRDAALHLEGMRPVPAMRGESGHPRREFTDPARYYDLSYDDGPRR